MHKTVLILAYDFPPYNSVGALRPSSWYQNFYDNGIYPIVITRNWSNEFGDYRDYISPSKNKTSIIEKLDKGTIIKTPYKASFSNRLLLKYGQKRFKLFRKVLTLKNELLQYRFKIGSKKELYTAAEKYLSENKVDLILATGDPFVLFHYSKKLSKKFNTPWIADYRDPWHQDVALANNSILRSFNKKQEKRSVSTAASIITVSAYLKHKISQTFPNKQIDVVENGYDSALLKINQEQSKTELNIGFAGTIYQWHPLISVLNCINGINANNELKICLNFFGISDPDGLKNLSAEYQNIKIQISKRLTNIDLGIELSKQNCLLLFNDYSYLGTKIFDYLALNRKILFCYSDDKEALELKKEHYTISEELSFSQKLQEEMILETSSGAVIEDQMQLESELISLKLELEKNGSIFNNTTNIQQYSRQNRVKTITKIIEDQLKNK